MDLVKERDIQSKEISKGSHMERRFIIYSKNGVPHQMHQLQDCVAAIETGAYFAKPPAQVKAAEAKVEEPVKRSKLSGITGKKKK